MATRNTRNNRETEPQDAAAAPRRRSASSRTQGTDAATRTPRTRRRRDAAEDALGGAAVAPVDAASAGEGMELQTVAAASRPVDVPHDHIAVRAYHLYLERGGGDGDDFRDWITAERELREASIGQR